MTRPSVAIRKSFWKAWAATSLVILIPTLVLAFETEDARVLLEQYEESPRAFMARSPSSGALGNPEAELADPELIKAKSEARQAILDAAGLVARSESQEKLENILDGQILSDPAEIDHLGLQSGTVLGETWSSSVWNMYRGHSAQRYALKRAREAKDWPTAWKFASKRGRAFADIVREGDPKAIDQLSPAEKYDLLIGRIDESPAGFLTRYEWGRGRSYYEQQGKVPDWFGYCHGWAPASFMVPRPERSVVLTGADGTTQIRFYPADIQALATVLWANALPRIRLVGGRCDETKPKRDQSGRVISRECLDVNPATFHLALVNQIGVAKQNLLIDATYDHEVWNQPIRSYKFKYFNPQSKDVARSFDEAVIPLEKFTKDKYRAYRSPNAVQVVGIALEVIYAQTSVPSQRDPADSKDDRQKKATYLYDLEIDENGHAIGGEWYQSRHPDFLWIPVKDARPTSDFESQARSSWNPSGGVPQDWRQAAKRSAENGQPLSKIVYELVELSRR